MRSSRPLLEPLLEAARAGARWSSSPADHGEGLGEHGEKTHGIFAYEATLRVPLILYAPRHSRRAAWYAERVRHVDLLPTILDALALPGAGGPAGSQPACRWPRARRRARPRATSRRCPPR